MLRTPRKWYQNAHVHSSGVEETKESFQVWSSSVRGHKTVLIYPLTQALGIEWRTKQESLPLKGRVPALRILSINRPLKCGVACVMTGSSAVCGEYTNGAARLLLVRIQRGSMMEEVTKWRPERLVKAGNVIKLGVRKNILGKEKNTSKGSKVTQSTEFLRAPVVGYQKSLREGILR